MNNNLFIRLICIFKKHTYLYVWVAILPGFQTACTYDNEKDLFGETACGTEVLSLQHDIQPIMAANCAISDCHVTGGQFPDFTGKENIIAHAGEIRTRTRNQTMPPASSGKSLTNEQIQRITCWVSDGASNN